MNSKRTLIGIFNNKLILGLLLSGVIVVFAFLSFQTVWNKDTQTSETSDIYSGATDESFANMTYNKAEYKLEVAKSNSKKALGLMNRTKLENIDGMIFLYPAPQELTFYMKNTLISLDIIFLDSELKVVTIHKNTKTEQTKELYPSDQPAQYVVEMEAGWSEANNLQIGDFLTLKL